MTDEDQRRAAERRHFGRIRQDEIRCNLGQVLDVSKGGLRIATHRKLKAAQRVVLANAGPGIRLSANVAWCTRLGFQHYIVGLQFVDVTADQMRWLNQAVHFGTASSAAIAPKAQSKERDGGSIAGVLRGLFLVGFGAAVHHFDPLHVVDHLPVIGNPLMSTVLAAAFVIVGALMLLAEVLSLRTDVARRVSPGRDRRKSSAQSTLSEFSTLRHLLRCVLDSSLSGVLVLTAVRDDLGNLIDFEVQMTSSAVGDLLGVPESELIHKRFSQALGWFADKELMHKLAGVVETGLPLQEVRWWQQHDRWLQLSAVKLRDSLTLSFSDITEQKHAEARMHHEAYHDTLTGLPNRKFFVEKLGQTIVNAKRRRSNFAVLFIDFDRFKVINDSLGHETGDMLLMSIADRMRRVLSDRDDARRGHRESTPARLGGDEFVILLDDIDTVADAERMAQKLVAEYNTAHLIAGHSVTSTASVGIVTSDVGHDNAQDVLRDADTAMYQAKKAGKSCYRVFSRDMHEVAVEQLNVERDLRVALDRGQFVLQYEPVICVESARVLGVEALVRWNHPQHGIIPPEQFIGHAEQLNLIQRIGEWVLRRACADLAAWRSEHPDRKDLFVSVNLSRRQLLDGSLTAAVRDSLKQHNLPPRCLWLEVTESVIAHDLDDITTRLHEIRDLGVRLAMDDFGTGYSSLHCLHMLPFDVIKIDQKLVASQWHDKHRYAGILHAVLELAHNLGLNVVAEGVETVDQLTLLQGLDCQYAQGWLFSKSLDSADITRLLSASNGEELQQLLSRQVQHSAA